MVSRRVSIIANFRTHEPSCNAIQAEVVSLICLIFDSCHSMSNIHSCPSPSKCQSRHVLNFKTDKKPYFLTSYRHLTSVKLCHAHKTEKIDGM